MTSGDGPPTRRTSRVRAWLELDLEAQPIEGSLSPPHGPPTQFIGWLGLTTALEGLRPRAEPPPARDTE